MGAVGVGLVVLALAAGPPQPAEVGVGVRFTHGRRRRRHRPAHGPGGRPPAAGRPVRGLALGLLSGLCFALLALGGRVVLDFHPLALVADPAAWATGGFAGLLGLLISATALQRASVVTVTAATVSTESVVGALLGVVVCGDRPLAGAEAYAPVLGFALALAGAVGLARFGGPAEDEAAGPPAREDSAPA